MHGFTEAMAAAIIAAAVVELVKHFWHRRRHK
jgi:hypothetical protein